jgi:hypothetical protein
MPAAVQDTAAANMQNALPMSIVSIKTEHGMQFQVNTRLNGETHNLLIDEKGKLLAVKDGTDLASLPAAVKDAISKEADPSKILTVEKVTEGELVSYGAVMKDDGQGQFLHVRIGADGTLKAKSLLNTAR